LTAVGAVVLALGLTVFGAVVDGLAASATDETLRTLFTLCFVLGGVLATVLVHRERVQVPVVATPLVYAVAAGVGGVLHAQDFDGSLIKTALPDAVTTMATHAPTLLILTACLAVLAVLRGGFVRRRLQLGSAGHRGA
jgi:hypothetical protein